MYSPPMQLCYAILPSDLNMDMITETGINVPKPKEVCRYADSKPSRLV